MKMSDKGMTTWAEAERQYWQRWLHRFGLAFSQIALVVIVVLTGLVVTGCITQKPALPVQTAAQLKKFVELRNCFGDYCSDSVSAARSGTSSSRVPARRDRPSKLAPCSSAKVW